MGSTEPHSETSVKRGTIEHPKTLELADRLGIALYSAVGLLESLWHWTARYTPRGNIGKFSDVSIARGVGWDRPPENLIDALVATGWLDRSQKYRLIVHDWHDHADNAVKKRVRMLADPTFATAGKADSAIPGLPDSRGSAFRDESGSLPDDARKGPGTSLPEPGPEPEPEPVPGTRSRAVRGGAEGGMPERIYRNYPRHEGRSSALTAIAKAIRRIAGKSDGDVQAASEWLLVRVEKYAMSPSVATTPKQFIPHPSTWFNQGRYDDDDLEWQRERTDQPGGRVAGVGPDQRRKDRATRELHCVVPGPAVYSSTGVGESAGPTLIPAAP